ncbi:hypothetical protein ACQRAS_00500 [Coprococcus catus]
MKVVLNIHFFKGRREKRIIFLVEGLSSMMPRASGSMVWASFSYIITPLVAMGLLYVAAKILTYVFPKEY